MSEGWHGVRFDQPLARTREYIEVVNAALARRTVAFDGEHYQLPLPDGPGKPLKLTIAPVSEHIPIYLAAVGPKNLELAGELADGWLAVFYAPDFAAEQLGQVRPAGPKVGKSLDGFDVVPTVPLVVGRRSARLRRPGPRVRRALRRRDGQPGAELLQRAGRPDGVRRGRGHGPGPVPRPAAAGRDGGGAVRVHRPDLAARRPGADRRAASGCWRRRG